MDLIPTAISVAGDPSSDAEAQLLVHVAYSNSDDPEQAREWLDVQLESLAGYGRVLAEVELDLLLKLRPMLEKRIRTLQGLEGRR